MVELKLAELSHENIGQLNTYVSWYRKNMMRDGDNHPIGILQGGLPQRGGCCPQHQGYLE